MPVACTNSHKHREFGWSNGYIHRPREQTIKWIVKDGKRARAPSPSYTPAGPRGSLTPPRASLGRANTWKEQRGHGGWPRPVTSRLAKKMQNTKSTSWLIHQNIGRQRTKQILPSCHTVSLQRFHPKNGLPGLGGAAAALFARHIREATGRFAWATRSATQAGAMRQKMGSGPRDGLWTFNRF